MKKILVFIVFVLFATILYAQNISYTKEIISTLASDEYHGRAYYERGDYKAASFIKKEYKKLGLAFFQDYFQDFSIGINTFPAAMELQVDGKIMQAGKDFVVREYSTGNKGTFDVYTIDTLDFSAEKLLAEINALNTENLFVACDFDFIYANRDALKKIQSSDIAGIIMFWDEPLHWYVAHAYFTIPKTILWLEKSAVNQPIKEITLNIENEFLDDYPTQNVIGYLEGKEHNDSFIVFTAHYDHLGHLGSDVFFPGANDNASGVAMLLNLAEYFAPMEHRPDYSLVFMAFAAEEAGLKGSEYYVNNPLFPMKQIRSVVNLDMVADLCDSVTLQSNVEIAEDLEILLSINKQNNYIEGFHLEDISPHSDHYSFHKKGIPALLFIMKGEIFKDYHTPRDNATNVYYDTYSKLFLLLKDYVCYFNE